MALRLKTAVVLLALLVIYCWMPGYGFRGFDLKGHHNDQYNLLTDGFLSGHLYMPGEVPPVDCGKASPRHEALLWHWCYSALTEKHFKTARKYAHRLVAAQPGNTSSWLLLVASALGPVAFALRNLISFRPSRSQ